MGLATAPEGELISLGKIFRRGRDPAAVETEKKLTQLHFCFSQVATSKRERFFPQKRIYRTTGSAVLVNEAFDDLMSKGSPMELCEYLEDFLDNHGANNGSGLHRRLLSELEILPPNVKTRLLKAYRTHGDNPRKCAWQFNSILKDSDMTLTETARARVTFKFFNEVVQYADLNEMTAVSLATAIGPVVFKYEAQPIRYLQLWGPDKRQRMLIQHNQAAREKQEERSRVFQLMVEEFDIVFDGLH